MSVEQIVYNALVASAAAASVVQAGSPTEWRIYPEVAPQTTQFPMIVFGVVLEERVKSLGGGPSSLSRTLVEVDCFARTLLAATALADAVSAALDLNTSTFKGIQQDRSNQYDEAQRVFRVSQDFAIWA